MGIEIERKFLVHGTSWRDRAARSAAYRQAYLNRGDSASVRVRISDQTANLNIKSAQLGIERAEFEYDIPLADAQALLGLAAGAVVEKTRYWVRHGVHTWEIDVFEGANAGLVLAEIELERSDEPFDLPPWLGDEVSENPRYYNVYLADHPFTEW